MAVFSQDKYFSIEEYFDIQTRFEEKLEYYDGKIIPVLGRTATHNEICANVIYAIKNALKNLRKDIVYTRVI